MAGETLPSLARRHNLLRNLIRVWIQKFEVGAFDDETVAADTIEAYEARIAALERLVGRQVLEIEFLKGALKHDRGREARLHPSSPAQRPLLIGIVRLAYYDKPAISIDDTTLAETMAAISESFEAFGYRRRQAALRHRGLVVNYEKIRRLMREHCLQPLRRRRYVATTDSDHELPPFPNLVKNMVPDGPNQLGWPTSPTIPTGYPILRRVYKFTTTDDSITDYGVLQAPFDRLACSVSFKGDAAKRLPLNAMRPRSRRTEARADLRRQSKIAACPRPDKRPRLSQKRREPRYFLRSTDIDRFSVLRPKVVLDCRIPGTR